MKKPAKEPDNDQFEVICYARRSSDSRIDQQEIPEESDDILIHDGVVYERITDDFKIDLNSIPKHAWERFIAATYEAVKEFLKQPGGREFLDSKIEELRESKESSIAKVLNRADEDL